MTGAADTLGVGIADMPTRTTAQILDNSLVLVKAVGETLYRGLPRHRSCGLGAVVIRSMNLCDGIAFMPFNLSFIYVETPGTKTLSQATRPSTQEMFQSLPLPHAV